MPSAAAVSHIGIVSGARPSTRLPSGDITARMCSARVPSAAARSSRFVQGAWRNTDRLADRELKVWNRLRNANTVSAKVRATSSSAPLASITWNDASTSPPIQTAVTAMRVHRRRVSSPASGERGGRSSSSPSPRSKASPTSCTPLETRLNQIICTGRNSSGESKSRLPMTATRAATPVEIRKKVAFCTAAKVTRPSRTADTMVEKLSSVSTMSAASRATSVPERPIATPSDAAFSAGASLTPSPVTATISPAASKARTMRSLSRGVTRAAIREERRRSTSAASSSASRSAPVTGFPMLPRPSRRPMEAAVLG